MCNNYGDGTNFAAEAFREVIAPSLWDCWSRACAEQNYRVGQQAERERRRAMSAADRKVDRLRRKIFNLACPHCDRPAVYPGGCLALTCLAPACGWKWCAFCQMCFQPKEGLAAHKHVAQCIFNPAQGEYLPPGLAMQYFSFPPRLTTLFSRHNASIEAQVAYFEFVQNHQQHTVTTSSSAAARPAFARGRQSKACPRHATPGHEPVGRDV
jgi:hypothetical protein